MDIFFHDPTDIPLPPEEVRIREFRAQPYPDGRRVRIYLELTPFQNRPNGEITIFDDAFLPVSTVSIIETVEPRMEMTLHLRKAETVGSYVIQVEIFYDHSTPQETDADVYPPSENRQVVDSTKLSFTIP